MEPERGGPRPPDPEPIRGRRVLVVGASGFVGRWVARAAARAGAEVAALVRDADAARDALAPLGVDAALHTADLERPGAAEAVLARVRPHVVFDLAGYGIDRAERDAARAARLNAELPAELAAAAARHRAPGFGGAALVRAGSAAEYGGAGGDLAETTTPRPLDLYGRTKEAGTRALAAEARRHGLPSLTGRLFTVYGPGEHPGRLLPSLLETAAGGPPLPLTEGLQARDFAYVADVAEALVALARTPTEPGDLVNVATGRLHRVRDFVRIAAEVLGIPEGKLQFGALPTRKDEMAHSPVAVARLRARLGRALPDRLAEGVSETAAFVLASSSRRSPRA